MQNIPVVAFSAWSGTGKTTIIEKLITELKSRGLSVAAIKHDAHDFEIDKEGKDSWRFTAAGASVTAVSSGSKTALIMQRKLCLSDIIDMISDVDIILAEGFNSENIPAIGISRSQTGKGFRQPPGKYIALVTDEPVTSNKPVFSLDDTRGLADFIINFFN